MTKEGMEREHDFKDNHNTLKRYYHASLYLKFMSYISIPPQEYSINIFIDQESFPY